MSRFLSSKFERLEAYVPGEQPKDKDYIKLNANESPYPPSPKLMQAIGQIEVGKLNLYPDATSNSLLEAVADYYSVDKKCVYASNSSDEVLSFIFSAYCDKENGIAYSDISYPFYPVFSAYYNIKPTIVPLRDDYSICVDDYIPLKESVIIANPNANTGIFVPVSEIERLIKSNTNRLVIIDEAYVDFGGESCIPLAKKYDNLIVVQTFSKSRSLAGARLGLAIACEEIINDINTIKFSFNPYAVNRLSMIAGAIALNDRAYFEETRKKIISTRNWFKKELEALGFFVLPSKANFVLVKSNKIDGKQLQLKLKDNGILIRHFDKERLSQFNRITIGTDEQMCILIDKIKEILQGEQL